MQNTGIIRNRRKIRAVVHNAKKMLENGLINAFTEYVYAFRDGKALSHDLKKKGFVFVGETICESFLMSVGAVQAHEPGCFLHR